jgi:hypothetical protein
MLGLHRALPPPLPLAHANGLEAVVGGADGGDDVCEHLQLCSLVPLVLDSIVTKEGVSATGRMSQLAHLALYQARAATPALAALWEAHQGQCPRACAVGVPMDVYADAIRAAGAGIECEGGGEYQNLCNQFCTAELSARVHRSRVRLLAEMDLPHAAPDAQMMRVLATLPNDPVVPEEAFDDLEPSVPDVGVWARACMAHSETHSHYLNLALNWHR